MHASSLGPQVAAKGRMASRLFKARFQSDNLSTRTTLADIRDAMEQAALHGDFISRVESVLAELFNNIAEHAYQDKGIGEVRCAIDTQGDSVIVEVMDQGVPMPGGEMPEGALPDIDVDFADLPEGGFGWFIIRSQVDQLTYQRRDLGNYTRLTFAVSRTSDD